MNQAELLAYGQIAEALTRHAHSMAESDSSELKEFFPGIGGPIYHHRFDSSFEWTAQSLWKLKILKGIKRQSDVEQSADRWPAYFAFTCDPAGAHSVAIKNWKAGPPLDELIENLIYLVGDYGTMYWGFQPYQTIRLARVGACRRCLVRWPILAISTKPMKVLCGRTGLRQSCTNAVIGRNRTKNEPVGRIGSTA